ncbi:MAG: RDD family protein [Polaribacter sp.]|nr:RDD family protein [Polaribacter sp.]MDG1227537.1 RDD family protein [Polaribacter sp.]
MKKKTMKNEQLIDKENVEYGKFWGRALAYLADGVILLLISLPITYLNITEYKSFNLYLIIAIVGVLYKPILEFYFGATIGKYLLGLKVTDRNYNKMSLSQSFLRSLILTLPSALFIPVFYLVFKNPDILKINSFMEYSQAVNLTYPIQNYISYVIQLILVIEIIILLTDKSKTQRALHDRIGGTFVVRTKIGK